jgi:hypothetical protein
MEAGACPITHPSSEDSARDIVVDLHGVAFVGRVLSLCLSRVVRGQVGFVGEKGPFELFTRDVLNLGKSHDSRRYESLRPVSAAGNPSWPGSY